MKRVYTLQNLLAQMQTTIHTYTQKIAVTAMTTMIMWQLTAMRGGGDKWGVIMLNYSCTHSVNRPRHGECETFGDRNDDDDETCSSANYSTILQELFCDSNSSASSLLFFSYLILWSVMYHMEIITLCRICCFFSTFFLTIRLRWRYV